MSLDNVRTGFATNWLRTTVDVMQPKEIGFVHPPRKWQSECFETIAPNNPISIINAPTGSGKSTMLSMLAYQRTVSDNKKKTIIAVPQTIIGKGFSTKVFKLPDGKVIDWSVGLDLVSDSDDCINQLINFIFDDIYYSKEYPFERIAVCSYNVLREAFHKLSDEEKEKYWKNLLICIDETHHLEMNEISDGVYEMNKLSQVIDYSFKNKLNNNEIILVSATMFRGDQKGLISKEMIQESANYKLPFDIYMEEMKHLKSFSYDFIIDTNEYTKDITKCIKNLFDENLKKLFIYIPHTTHFMSTGNKTREDKKKEIKIILEQLKNVLNGNEIVLNKTTGVYHIKNSEGLDYKVCDLYDEELFNSKTKDFVNDEKINKNRDSLDCIITMNRAKEGFDWEHANGMIVVGQRNSLTDVIQMVGRLLRDKQGKEKVKALHMLPFSPNQPTAPNLDNSLNDFFKAIAISLLMEDVFAPTSLQTNDDSAPTGQLSGATSSVSSNIFDDLELDENQRLDLFDKAQKALVNGAGGLVESQGTYSPEQLKEQMPSIMKKWVEENKIEADEQQIEELAKKVYNQFAKRTLQMQGLNVSNINWQMIESADPIEFTLRYVGKDTTLESLKELRRLISYGESESNVMCHKVCQWIVENNINPSQASPSKEERKLGKWIIYQRQAKAGNNDKPFYISNLNIAKSYNLDNLFDRLDYESESNEICHQYFNWVKENDGEFPSSKSTNEEEMFLGCWIVKQRSAKQGVGLQKYYGSNEKIAESYGYKNIFERLDYELVSNDRSIEVVKFYNINNRLPKRCEDEYESKLAQHLTKIKSKYLSNDIKFYLSDFKVFESAGLQNVFLSDEEDFNKKLIELFEWIKNENNNVLPREKSSNTTEVLKAKFVGSLNLKRNLSDLSIKIATQYGFPNIFEKKNYEQESNFLTTQLCKFYKENERFPYESGDDYEKKLSRHHKSCRIAKSGKSGNIWYDSDQKIAESFGYNNMFDNLPLLQSNENCKSFCEFIITEKRFPVGSKNAPEFERKLRKWHDGKKAIHLGKKSGAFYESDISIATSFGFANLFELSSYSGDKE